MLGSLGMIIKNPFQAMPAKHLTVQCAGNEIKVGDPRMLGREVGRCQPRSVRH